MLGGLPVVLANLAAVLVLAKAGGRAAERLGQPAVLGELLAGLLLGATASFDAELPALRLLAEAGVVVLLFQTGLTSDPRGLLKAGPRAAAVACAGVVLPFVLGWGVMRLWGRSPMEAVLVGAAFTATSVGITARVLSDLGRLGSQEGQIILGAAVVDDFIGIGILALVTSAGAAFSSLPVLAAFAGGLVLAGSRRRPRIETLMRPAVVWLVPVFFVMAGARVRLGAPGSAEFLPLAAVLSAAAILGKTAAGWAAWGRTNKLAIGAGMVPRGEVGLLFAQAGLASGVLAPGLYGAVVGMVAVTTFVTPLFLKRAFRAA